MKKAKCLAKHASFEIKYLTKNQAWLKQILD